MIIRFADINEYPDVLLHYEACGYGGGLTSDDNIIVACDLQIIGAVRVCTEQNLKVLRGMYIKQEYQKQGIGKSMLRFLADKMMLNTCYCLPYKHLKSFYAAVGFKEILPAEAPVFLADRHRKYLDGLDQETIIMVRGSDVAQNKQFT